MKKIYSLIAAALLTTASTQALAVDTSFWGVLHEYVETDNVTGGPTDNKPGVKLTNFISVIGFKAVEPLNDIDPGLKFQLDLVSDFYSDAPNSNYATGTPSERTTRIGNQQSTAGFIDDNWGVTFGHNAHAVWENLRSNAPLRDLEGSMIGEIHQRQKLRLSNAVFTWVKPIDGIKLGYEHGFSEVQGRGDAQTFSAEVTMIPNLRLTGTHYQEGYTATGYAKENKTDLFTASYQVIEGTKVWYTYSNDTYQDKVSQGNSIYVSQVITPRFNVAAGYGWRDTDNVKGYVLGANYSLTKHLTLQARVLKETADNAINMTTANDLGGIVGKDRTNIGIGVEFLF